MRNLVRKHSYIGIFVLMLSLILPPSAFAMSNSDFNAMMQKAEQRRVAIAQMMEASTIFIIAQTDDGFGMGTGFIIQKDYIVTNAHVVEGGSTYYVAGKSFAPIEATLVKKLHTDAADFALLKFKQPVDLPVLSFNLSLSRTDKVSAWGYPYLVTQFDQNMDKICNGNYANLPPVVYTEGVVSAFVESLGGQSIIHSAAIAAGNSGGPLINTQGEVVGINTWGATIEGDGAFVNASLPAHAIIKFLRSCSIEPLIVASNADTILTMQGYAPSRPIGSTEEPYSGPSFFGNNANNGNSGSVTASADAAPSVNPSAGTGDIPVGLPSYLGGGGAIVGDSGDNSGDGGNAVLASAEVFPSAEAAAQLTGQAKAVYDQAVAGDAEAQCYVGASYYMGDEAPEREAEGVYWLQKAADQGSLHAMYVLGSIYLTNADFKNTEEGLALVRKASEGDAEYSCVLAYFLLRGEIHGVPRDVKGGFEAAQRGADAGDAEAVGLLAYAYATGAGVERDEAHAFELAQKAANEGDGFAHAVLSMLYCVSEEVPEDYAKALECAQIAADNGSNMGKGMLAVMFIIEENPKLSAEDAKALAAEGAANGDEVSQFAMGMFSMDESYGKEDFPLAWAYFEMSARKDFVLSVTLRDEMETQLSADVMAQGAHYIELWEQQWGI